MEGPGGACQTRGMDWSPGYREYSERQLHRRCVAAVGYGPVLLRRVLRFRQFVSRIDAGAACGDLGVLAAEAGYADQAHLTRESRDLAGLPPAALARLRRTPPS